VETVELSHIAARKRQKFYLWTLGLCTVGERQKLGKRGRQWTLQPQSLAKRLGPVVGSLIFLCLNVCSSVGKQKIIIMSDLTRVQLSSLVSFLFHVGKQN